MWWTKFKEYAKTQYGVDFTDDESKQIRDDFFSLYSSLGGWHDAMRAFVRKHGFVRAWHGALRRLPSAFSDDKFIIQDTERQAINSPIHRAASDFGLLGLCYVFETCHSDLVRPLAFIHDAGVFEVKLEVLEEAMSHIKYCMQNQVEFYLGKKFPIPLLSDVSVGANLGDMDERSDVEPKFYKSLSKPLPKKRKK